MARTNPLEPNQPRGGGISFDYKFNTATGGSPAVGQLQGNNVDLSLATVIDVNDIDDNAQDISAILAASSAGRLMLTDASSGASITYTITGAPTDNGSDFSIPVTIESGSVTTFPNLSSVFIGFDLIGAGDVVGPAVAVNDNFAAFDGVGGKTIKDSGSSAASFSGSPHALGGADHSTDTLANLNSKVSDATLIDTGDSRLSDARTPTAHALGGVEHTADTLANLNSKVSDATLIDTGDSRLSDARTPTGAAGGELAGTYPNPTVNDGADGSAIHDNIDGEINGLTDKPTPVGADVLILEDSAATFGKKKVLISNLPAGAPAAHALGGAQHTADTLANLNSKVSDATLIDTGDSRLSDARTPTGTAGGELSGTYPNPTVNDGADGSAIHDNVAAEISVVTEKGVPIAADLILIEDSADSNNKKRVQIGNLPAPATTPQEMFFPMKSGSDSSGDYGGTTIPSNAVDFFNFFIPTDFSSLTSLVILGIPVATIAAANIDLLSDYAAVGETAQANSESDLVTTYNLTINTLIEIDLSGVFSAIAAGDYCGLQVDHNSIGTSILYTGIRMRYT